MNVDGKSFFKLRHDVDPSAALARVTEKRWIRIESELELLASRVQKLLGLKGIEPASAPPSVQKNAPVRDLVIW